jgi:hypothetical protein
MLSDRRQSVQKGEKGDQGQLNGEIGDVGHEPSFSRSALSVIRIGDAEPMIVDALFALLVVHVIAVQGIPLRTPRIRFRARR